MAYELKMKSRGRPGMELSEIIIDKIRKDGPISFRDFMELSLYYPGSGYYTSAGDKTGENGDFYTSPHVSGLFGELITMQLEEMWHLSGKKEFMIIEYGAGNGTLCYDILNQSKLNKELYSRLTYYIIEKNKLIHEKGLASGHEKVFLVDSVQEISPVTGCMLSNEVLDNFSVHRVVMKDELMEIFVDYQDGFIEVLRPASEELKDYFSQLCIKLPREALAEINIQALQWVKEVAVALKKGFVITIDYGFTSHELYNKQRSMGTLLSYHKHMLIDCPYINIGKQDITAHINFSALHHWGKKNGLELCGFTSQSDFLHALGLAHHLRKQETMKNREVGIKEKLFLLQTFLLEMGNKLKVLIQQKGMNNPKLTGLQFARQFI